MRALSACISLLIAATISTAQNAVTVTGTVTPCLGASYPVQITTNSIPAIDTVVYTSANCAYSFTFWPVSDTGVVVVETTCDGGITWSSAIGTWNPFFPVVTMNLSCTSGPCLLEASIGAFNPNPWEVTFSAVAGNGTPPYQYNWALPNGEVSMLPVVNWTASDSGSFVTCLVVTDANGCVDDTCLTFFMDADGNMTTNNWFPCNPCVTIAQSTDGPAGPPIPWALEAVNCSSGGMAPITYGYQWSTGETTQQITASSPGQYQVCIYMTDANGCQAITCDSVMVDSDGNVGGGATDPCEAGFWVMQAYEMDSINGGPVPIPNLLWVWNLSTGGNGNNQFFWDFGDGTSSTDPYPTHVYANGGPYILCLTRSDTQGCTDTACDSVSVDGNGMYTGMAPQQDAERSGFTIQVLNEAPTAIEDVPVESAIAAWPNPVSDLLNLRINTTVNGSVPMTITDMDGRVVRMEAARMSSGGNTLHVPVGDLAPGLYLLRFGNDARAVALRFAKQ